MTNKNRKMLRIASHRGVYDIKNAFSLNWNIDRYPIKLRSLGHD